MVIECVAAGAPVGMPCKEGRAWLHPLEAGAAGAMGVMGVYRERT